MNFELTAFSRSAKSNTWLVSLNKIYRLTYTEKQEVYENLRKTEKTGSFK